MVFQLKNHNPKKLMICIYLRGLNKITLTELFPTPFIDEIMNKVSRHECYSSIDGFSSYNQVPITKVDQEKPHLSLNWLICMQSDSLWIKKCPYSLFKNGSEGIPRIYIYNDWTIYSLLRNLLSTYTRSANILQK
jgi:hypothetical protein